MKMKVLACLCSLVVPQICVSGGLSASHENISQDLANRYTIIKTRLEELATTKMFVVKKWDELLKVLNVKKFTNQLKDLEKDWKPVGRIWGEKAQLYQIWPLIEKIHKECFPKTGKSW